MNSIKIKKILGFFIVLILLATSVSFSYADKEQNRHGDDHNDGKQNTWNLTGSCVISYTGVNIDPGPYVHTYNVTSMNTNTGVFSGTGFYNPDPTYTEALTGNVTGNNVTFHSLYTGTNAGYFVDATGSISNIGILSGTALSSTGQTFTFVSNAACAQKTHGDDHQDLKLDWKKEVNAKQCNAKGEPIINVTQKITNDEDSGVAGNFWAFDTINREIKVYKTGVEGATYCATVSYEGKFVTLAGASPDNTGSIAAGIKGEFEGGYRSTQFTGTLLSVPLWPTHGSVGTTDYLCDGLGNCPGAIDWTTQYFSSTSGFDLAWWGWIYNAEHHGTWINAISGNSGDIL